LRYWRLGGQVEPAIELSTLNQIFGGPGVDLPSAMNRIDKSANAYRSKSSRLAGCDVPVHVGDNSQRQVIGLDKEHDHEA
jgi:hypothetical protein